MLGDREAHLKRILDKLRLGNRSIPDFLKTKKELESFDKTIIPELVDIKKIYDYMMRNQASFELTGLELVRGVEAVFVGAGDGRPPVYGKGSLINRFYSIIKKERNARAADSFVSSFFNIYPKYNKCFENLRTCSFDLLKCFKKGVSSSKLVMDVFSINGAYSFARKIDSRNSLFEAMKETGINMAPDAEFFRQAWVCRFPVYASLMRIASEAERSKFDRGLTEKEKQALKVIYSDSCFREEESERSFRFVKASEFEILGFIDALTRPYDKGAKVLENDSNFPFGMISELSDFLQRAFPPESFPMPKVQEKIKNLIQFWNSGSELLDAFDFADYLVLRLKGNGYSWWPRLHYWKSYWLAGRMVKGPNLYANANKNPMRIKKDYEEKINRKIKVNILTVRGSMQAKVCLAFFIEPGMVAVEGDENFALRIGTFENAQRGFLYSQYPSADMLMKGWKFERITHTQKYWQSRANDVFRRYTGRACPVGTGG